VITEGLAKRESVQLIRSLGAEPAGVVIALDRRERTGTDDALSSMSAVQAFEQTFGIPIVAIADFNDLLEFLDSGSPLAVPAQPYRAAMQAYRSRYGV
jgi:orotate phosphoribosyltransferase